MPPLIVLDGLGRDRHLGACKPDPLDDRDAVLASSPSLSKRLPPRVDWFADAPRARDQGADSTCTGHTARSICLWETYALQPQLRLDLDFDYSPLFPYWCGRVEDGTPTDLDDGVTMRSMFQAIVDYGICQEKLLPYGPGRYNVEPSAEAFVDATRHQAIAYLRLVGLDAVKLQLARGYLVAAAIDCPPSLMEPGVARNGLLPWDGRPSQGRHALTIIGYDDDAFGIGDGGLRMLNSWGLDWGVKGTFILSYRYAREGLLSDTRCLQRIES